MALPMGIDYEIYFLERGCKIQKLGRRCIKYVMFEKVLFYWITDPKHDLILYQAVLFENDECPVNSLREAVAMLGLAETVKAKGGR